MLPFVPAFGVPATVDAGFPMRSLRFDGSSAYLSKTPGSAGDRKTWTWSAWVKRSKLGTFQWLFGCGPVATDYTYIRFNDNDTLEYTRVIAGVIDAQKVSTAVFRDTSAWYHIVVCEDAANTVSRVYVNGAEVAYATNNNPSNINGALSNNVAHEIGRYVGSATNLFDGYLSDAIFVDGQALTPSNFAETNPTTGQWVPKSNPTDGLTTGTNGFWLSFDNAASTTTLGYDDAGGARGAGAGSNDWTLNNFSVTAGVDNDSLFDVPVNYADGANGRGNFCTLNPLVKNTLGTVSDGSLRFTGSGTAWAGIACTIGVSSGKWYWEYTSVAATASEYHMVGIAASSWQKQTGSSSYLGESVDSWGYYGDTGEKYVNGAGSAYGSSFGANAVIGVALDMDTGKVFFSKDGVWQNSGDPVNGTGEAFSGLSSYAPIHPGVALSGVGNAGVLNFGQRPFVYTLPTGFKALCTQNLPEPSILLPSMHFDAVAYNLGGVGGDITSLDFQPDLVWIKSRANATGHRLVDAVRGVTKSLASETTGDEATEASGLTAFLSNGFTLGTDADYNPNAAQVAWCWKEGAVPGFDIVTYTGNGANRTINHDLGAVPKMIIIKARTTAGANTSWVVYHASNTAAPETDYLLLNFTSATTDDIAGWNDTAPTSAVFTIGNGAAVNTNNDTFVAYLFAEVPGFSKFGNYTGNADADGPFVWCGFRPKFVLIKCSSTTGDWWIYDVARGTINAVDEKLLANSTAVEDAAGEELDILANGFKLRSTAAGINGANTYVFAAFAESPFKYANAR